MERLMKRMTQICHGARQSYADGWTPHTTTRPGTMPNWCASSRQEVDFPEAIELTIIHDLVEQYATK
jgi:hypothetical protein